MSIESEILLASAWTRQQVIALLKVLALKASLSRPQFVDWVGIGVEPDRPLLINSDANTMAIGTSSAMIFGSTDRERFEVRTSAAGGGGAFQGKASAGTPAVPTAITGGRALLILGGSGHNGVDWVGANRAQVRFLASETWTAIANGTRIAFQTTPAGSVTTATYWQIEPSGDLLASTDNVTPFCGPANRCSVVYSATGAINTSDARAKTAIAPLSPDELAAASEMVREIGRYQWLDMIADKGVDVARLHIGLTVQRAIEIMAAHGLDPMRYGFICYDQWDALPEILGEDGEVLQAARAAGDRYSFRDNELALWLARGAAAERDALEVRIAALEAP